MFHLALFASTALLTQISSGSPSPSSSGASPSALPAAHGPHGMQLVDGFRTQPGFRPVGSQSLPMYANFAQLAGQRTVVFDGLHIDVMAANGALQHRLATLPSYRYPSFVIADESVNEALIGESSHGDILRVDLGTGALGVVANVPFAYAAVVEDAQHLIVSVAPCFFQCGNDLVRVDRSSGQVQTIGHVSGASGPLAFGAAGELVYATQADFIPLPHSLSVFTWSAAQVASATPSTPLTLGNGHKLCGALDGAGSIAIDERGGHVFVAESRFNGPSEIVEFDRDGRRIGLVARSIHDIANLCVEPLSTGPGALEPWQPRGVRLHWSETDFNGNLSWHRAAEPARPVARVEHTNSGAVLRTTLIVDGCPPGSVVELRSCDASAVSATEIAHVLGSFTIFSCVPWSTGRVTTVIADAAGRASSSWIAPAHATAQHAWQAFAFDAAGDVVASSTLAYD